MAWILLNARNLTLGETMKQFAAGLLVTFSLLATQAKADVIPNVAEATSYSLVYSLAIPDIANFNVTGVPYTVDNHTSFALGSFDRVAYYLTLQNALGQLQYAYVSMDAFTNDVTKIGVPSTASTAFFQQHVSNMNVISNVAGVVNGTGINTGSIEFWHTDYVAQNGAGVAGASNDIYDFGDRSTGNNNYGSMQIANYGAAQTIIAYNNWGAYNTVGDIGIGNQSINNPDWTFAANANTFTIKNIEVLVERNVPEPGSMALLGLGLLSFVASRRKSSKRNQA